MSLGLILEFRAEDTMVCWHNYIGMLRSEVEHQVQGYE